jgi:hypothetical protein
MGFLLAGYYLSGVLYSVLCVIADVILDDVMLYLKHYPLFFSLSIRNDYSASTTSR